MFTTTDHEKPTHWKTQAKHAAILFAIILATVYGTFWLTLAIGRWIGTAP